MYRQIKTLISRVFQIESGRYSGGLSLGTEDKQAGNVACGKYEARLEDYLQGAEDSELDRHLSQCVDCNAALENARLGRVLLHDAWEPVSESDILAGSRSEVMLNNWNSRQSNVFAAGVMARIREEKVRGESPAAFWNPLEFLASRVSLTAAALLFALSMYILAFAPVRAPSFPASIRTELNATDFPQPPGDPDSNEEVLQSLVERNYGSE